MGDGQRGHAIVEAMEEGGLKISDKTMALMTHGASEQDFAHSALADCMMEALDQIIANALEHKIDLRTAAMAGSVQKVSKVMSLSGNVFTGKRLILLLLLFHFVVDG